MNPILDAPYVAERKFTYAGFWIRFVATLIDSFILVLIDVSIRFAIFGTVFTTNFEDEDVVGGGVYGLMSFAIYVAYHTILESSSKQGTIGKMALGIKVATESGERITPLNALGRYFAKILSTIILLIGYIMVAFDAKKQGLHDKIARTIVYEG
jgi:uncharacterized RDD family membrane protein YckC